MSHSWITSVTNRVSTSYYNLADINRVDNNCRYLIEYLTIRLSAYAHCIPSGYATIAPVLEDYTDQTMSGLPKSSLINLVERNIDKITEYYTSNPINWLNMKFDWVAYNAFLHTDANRWESNLELLKTDILAFRERLAETHNALLFCGAELTICGKQNTLF